MSEQRTGGPGRPDPPSAWLRRRLLLLRLSLRNTWRQARRSALTASAMTLGLALLMISRAIADGGHDQWIDDGVRLASGHVALQSPGFQASGSLSDRLEPAAVARAEAAVRADAVAPLVRATAPRLQVSGLASSPGAAVPVAVQGVDPVREAAFSRLQEQLVEGQYLRGDDRLQAYVGIRLAERLGLRVGSRLVLTAQGASGEIADQLVRVRGIFRTGIPEMDEGLIQIPLTTARAWLGTPGSITTLAVLLHSSRRTDEAVRRLRAALQTPETGSGRIRVLPWQTASPELDSAVKIDDYGDYVFHGVLFGIIALAVLNAVLMSVLNRKREFGVLRALGLTRRETGAVVFAEGLLLTALSGAVGIALGFGITWIFWRHGLDFSSLLNGEFSVSGSIVNPVIVPEFRLAHVAQSLAFIFIVGVLASFYPARQAMAIDVAEAMKFDR